MIVRVAVSTLVAGSTEAPALALDEPVSLWGGVDPATGCIVDRLHPQHGVSLAASAVFMPFGRGSSSASSILVEMVRLGTAPAAFVLRGPDEMLTIGSLVADELYGRSVPIVVVDEIDESDEFDGPAVRTGDLVRVNGSFLEIERG